MSMQPHRLVHPVRNAHLHVLSARRPRRTAKVQKCLYFCPMTECMPCWCPPCPHTPQPPILHHRTPHMGSSAQLTCPPPPKPLSLCAHTHPVPLCLDLSGPTPTYRLPCARAAPPRITHAHYTTHVSLHVLTLSLLPHCLCTTHCVCCFCIGQGVGREGTSPRSICPRCTLTKRPPPGGI